MPLIMFVSSSFNTYVNLPKKKKTKEMPPLVNCNDKEIAYPVEGEALVIRCTVNMQIK